MSKANGNGNGSHLDWIRARHEAITADRHFDVEVPGYQGRLVLRFEPVPWAALTRAQALLEQRDKDGRASLYAQADVLIASCRGVLIRQEDGSLESVDPDGETRRIDSRLAELLGLDEGSTARDTIRWLFGNDIALAIAAGEVMTWTRDGQREASEETAGK